MSNELKITPVLRRAFREHRLALGLTYSALGRFFGTSWATIRKWEIGLTSHCRHQQGEMFLRFIKGHYDLDFRCAMNSSNISAYLRPVSPEAIECLHKLTNTYRLLATRPDLQMEFLDRILGDISETLEEFVNTPPPRRSQLPAKRPLR
ncbi:MAG: hypothetical protein MJ106_01355 [Lentisphaeria bacterium]|nr:hypothetical protein [Lentisphaeria bacterium]